MELNKIMTKKPPIFITLTPAQPADLDAMTDIRLDAMRESLERIGRFDPQRARERFDNYYVRRPLGSARSI